MKDVMLTKSHRTKKTIIWQADIDIAILPLIKWLNSLPEIITRWSCAGGEKNHPYVSIWSEHALSQDYGGKRDPMDPVFALIKKCGGIVTDRFLLPLHPGPPIVILHETKPQPVGDKHYCGVSTWYVLFRDKDTLQKLIKRIPKPRKNTKTRKKT